MAAGTVHRPVLVLLLGLVLVSGGAEALGHEAYGSLYQMGKEAYLEEDYRSCVNLLLQALQGRREFEQLLVECRHRCRQQAAGEPLLITDAADGELATFERLIRETRCLVQCHRERLGQHVQQFYDSAWADDEFRERKPYEYLQLCYYKTGEIQKAANAAFTVLLQQPNNEVMRENFKYYTTMEEVNNADIVSLEPQEHTELYVRGNAAYESERWPQVSRLMEEALDGFLEAERRCRTLCERFFPQGFNPDFVSNVANHFAYVLRCKLRCPEQLSTVAGNYLSDYLESHFHYLQFAYFKQNMLREACSNVANYLLFKPNDQDMLGNKQLYLKEEDVDESFFTPRADILEISRRIEKERKLDNYILEYFRFSDDDARKKGDTAEA
ncbi:Cartilage-associated protein [Amphibalanus amphitrite]|uniref:Cartilage-associated protein n=1 Tax=Amphibalanus amphitrite TaxID=1232801 RepID=A0A6A4WP18_AMPAM|nr:Cartilage-associated protein [Amphibalanus amphitrite]